jgi:hypothetical protein
VHPTEPGQDATLESLELLASDVAPALGWSSTTRTSSRGWTGSPVGHANDRQQA